MRNKVFLIIIVTAIFNNAFAQEKLIDFTISQIEINRIEISWKNPCSSTIQLSIQRSIDNKNFRTILSAEKPGLLNNKMTDTQLPVGVKVYYRIYYVLAGGSFNFSNTLNTTDNLLKIDSKQASSIDNTIETDIANNNKLSIKKITENTFQNTAKKNANNQKTYEFINLTKAITNNNPVTADKKNTSTADLNNTKDNSSHKKNELIEDIELSSNYYYHIPIKNRELVKISIPFEFDGKILQKIKNIKSNIKLIEYIFIYQKDSLITKLDPNGFLKYKDSLRLKTKDTLYVFNKTYASLHPFIPVYVWKPSLYVFNSKKGEPTIQIATAKKHNYRLVFKNEKGLFLFQLSPIKEEQLFLDKSNFLHAGWFEFELYEDEKLLEKNKIFIQ